MDIIFSREAVEMVMFFFIYSFIGWVLEVAFHALKCGKFINRGMLAGAVCPIYGFGAVILIYLLEPIKSNLLLLFLGSAVLCTILEYFAGLILDKLFHKRWWDYSDVPYNIGGYVCLQFSVYWGIGGILLIRDIQGLIGNFVNIFSTNIILIADAVFVVTMLIDVLATVKSINKLNKKLDLLGELQEQIHNMSDKIGEGVSEKTLKIAEKSKPALENLEAKKEARKERVEEIRKEHEENAEKIRSAISQKLDDRAVKIDEMKAYEMNKLSKSISGKDNFIDGENKYTIEELKKKKNMIHNHIGMNERRLIKAFPSLKENKRTKEFKEVKERVLNKKKGA